MTSKQGQFARSHSIVGAVGLFSLIDLSLVNWPLGVSKIFTVPSSTRILGQLCTNLAKSTAIF